MHMPMNFDIIEYPTSSPLMWCILRCGMESSELCLLLWCSKWLLVTKYNLSYWKYQLALVAKQYLDNSYPKIRNSRSVWMDNGTVTFLDVFNTSTCSDLSWNTNTCTSRPLIFLDLEIVYAYVTQHIEIL